MGGKRSKIDIGDPTSPLVGIHYLVTIAPFHFSDSLETCSEVYMGCRHGRTTQRMRARYSSV